MDKIAVISDVHGNLEALKVVLDDIKQRKIKKVICIGDTIAKGTHQHECLNLVRDNCDIVLRGNCDNNVIKYTDLSTLAKLDADRIRWNKSKLSDDDIEYLKSLPYCYEFYMSGRLIRLFHATPEKISGFIGNIDKIDNLYKLFLPSDNTSDKVADVVVYGHIHIQYVQRIYNRVIINTGSVGNAIDVFRNNEKDGSVKNTTVANYLIISGKCDSRDINEKISYELVNIPYDIEKELKANDENIEKDAYEEEIRKGKYRDMKKIFESFESRGIDRDKI